MREKTLFLETTPTHASGPEPVQFSEIGLSVSVNTSSVHQILLSLNISLPLQECPDYAHVHSDLIYHTKVDVHIQSIGEFLCISIFLSLDQCLHIGLMCSVSLSQDLWPSISMTRFWERKQTP